MKKRNRQAFTMIELVFVIVIIGILAAIAIPKLAATRDDAIIAKARATLASVRSSLSTERQRRILRGSFTAVSDLGDNTYAFRYFDNNSSYPVLEYPIRNCQGSARGCWKRTNNGSRYWYRIPYNTTDVRFNLTNNKLKCQHPNNKYCKLLSE